MKDDGARTLTRGGLIEKIRNDFPHLSNDQVDRAIRAFFENTAQHLQGGGRVEIRGFGSFTLRYRQARVGRNPRTGESVEVARKANVYFRCGEPLFMRLNPKHTMRPKKKLKKPKI